MSVSMYSLRSRLRLLLLLALVPLVGLVWHWGAVHRWSWAGEGTAMAGLLVSAAIAWWAAYHLLWRPLDALVEATRRLKAGEPPTRIKLPGESGGFGPLAAAVDEFAAELQQREAQQSRSAEEIRRLNRALKVLSRGNQAVIRATGEQQLLESVCQIVVRDGGYRFAWVGFADQDEAKTVRPVAQAGLEEGYLESVNVTWADNDRGRGPMGTPIRTGQVTLIRNILQDPAFAPWLPEAQKRGYASVVGLPLLVGGKAFGTLGIYATEPDAFDAQEIALLTELADDLSYGVIALRTQEERDRGEERMRWQTAALESAANAIVITDRSGTVLWVNCAFTRLTGYAPVEVLGKEPRLLKSGRHDADFYRNLWDTITSGRTWHGEIVNRRKDGSLYTEEMTITPVRNGPGEISHFIAIKQDITERKHAQKTMADALAYTQQILDTSPLGIITYKASGEVVAANPASAQLVGCSMEQVMAQNFRHLESWRRSGLLAAAEEALASGEQRHCETHATSTFGKEIWVNSRFVPFTYGDEPHLLALFEDIAERRQAELQLLRKTEELEAIFQSLPDLYFRMRRDGTVLDYLSGAQGKLYVPPEQFLGKKLQQVLPAEVGRRFEKALHELERSAAPVSVEYELPMDGQSSLFEARLNRLHGDEVVALVRDVTERRRLEEQFRQAQKMEAVGRLAGGIAHDFNNMLGVIIGYTQLLQERLAGQDTTDRQLAEVKKAGDRAAALTRQLLAFSRKQVLHVRTLELDAVVGDLSKMLRRMIGDDIELVIRARQPVGPVLADPSQMEQVLMNLAVNARDAMPQGGKLIIETANVDLDETYAALHKPTQPGPYVMLAVSDTGCGMNADTQARIFEPFFTTKEMGKGTGLGLSTVYGVVKQSGGYIWVYSEPGHGTTFKIYLPRIEKPLATEPLPKGPSSPRTVPATILLVEDEEAMRKLVCSLLEHAGFTVLPAKNGAEALERAGGHAQKIDLLLTDVVMPGMSGREVAERVAAQQPGLKTLYMSGYTDDLVAQHGALGPGMMLLEKPFTKESLLTKVDEVLREELRGEPAGPKSRSTSGAGA